MPSQNNRRLSARARRALIPTVKHRLCGITHCTEWVFITPSASKTDNEGSLHACDCVKTNTLSSEKTFIYTDNVGTLYYVISIVFLINLYLLGVYFPFISCLLILDKNSLPKRKLCEKQRVLDLGEKTEDDSQDWMLLHFLNVLIESDRLCDKFYSTYFKLPAPLSGSVVSEVKTGEKKNPTRLLNLVKVSGPFVETPCVF